MNLIKLFFICLVVFPFSAFADRKIKIGISLPLSGEVSYMGNDIRNSLEFINKEIGGDKFELVFEDDKCQPKEATAVANKLINVDQVKAVLVSCTMSIIPTATIYQKSNIPVIVTLGSSSQIAKLGAGIFRVSTNDYFAAKKYYETTIKDHRKILALVDENDYSIAFFNDLKSFFQPHQEIKHEFFKVDNLDFRSLVLRNKSYNPDGIVILPLSQEPLISLIRQIRGQGLNQKIYTAYMQFPNGILAGIEGDGVYNLINTNISQSYTEAGNNLYQKFLSLYPKPSYDLTFVGSIEAYRSITQAILNSPDDINNYLTSATFNGLIGNWKFNKDREVDFWNFEVQKVSN